MKNDSAKWQIFSTLPTFCLAIEKRIGELGLAPCPSDCEFKLPPPHTVGSQIFCQNQTQDKQPPGPVMDIKPRIRCVL